MCLSSIFSPPSPPQIQAPPPAPDPVKPMVNPERAASSNANSPTSASAASRRKLRTDLPTLDTGAGLTIPS